MSDLAKRLRIKAGMIEMGELIEWGSDSALMREAADALGHAAVERKKVGRPQIREVFLRNGAVIPADRDDLPDYVYESVFELLEMDAPDVQGEPVALPTDAQLVEIARNLGALPELCGTADHPDLSWHIRTDVRNMVREVLKLYAAPQPVEEIGEVAVTKDKFGNIVSVTRQDVEGRVLSVIAESDRCDDDYDAAPRPSPDVSGLVAIAREIVDLHAKRKVVLTVHVEALEDALASYRKQGVSDVM